LTDKSSKEAIALKNIIDSLSAFLGSDSNETLATI
jgi:hypothetical protein